MTISWIRCRVAVLAFVPLAATGLLNTGLCAEPLASPESQGVLSDRIVDWIEANEAAFDAMHGFVIRRHGRVIAEGTWAPFDTLNKPHMLYSHSKSFTSTAVGFLVDDGKLDLDERVVDIFPEMLPTNVCENLRQLRVRDLLTMNVGAENTKPVRRPLVDDWVRAFLANPIEHAPGTKFKYNSMATFMLSAIVRRKAGCDLMDFLNERLFVPLSFGEVWSGTSPDGTPCGGWGMNMTTRDLAKFGQLYLDGGCWDGHRLLSEEWVTMATARQTWSGPIAITGEDGSDWHQGYGFQFWRCRHGAYRADGADGQLTVVLPNENAVVSVSAGLKDMQKELNLIWEHLLPAFCQHPQEENPVAVLRLRKKCAGLKIPALKGEAVSRSLPCVCEKVEGDCPFGFKSLRLEKTSFGWDATEGGRLLAIGDGDYALTDWEFSKDRVEPLFALTMVRKVAACGAWSADGRRFTVKWYVLGGIQRGEFFIQ